MGAFHPVITFSIAAGMVMAEASVAAAAVLSFAGRVHLYQPVAAAGAEGNIGVAPVPAARVTVTFHGHEAGITEYMTERMAQVVTDETGYFDVDIKLSEYRYRWTHVTIAVEATDMSKATTVTAVVYDDGQGGSRGNKNVQVRPWQMQ